MNQSATVPLDEEDAEYLVDENVEEPVILIEAGAEGRAEEAVELVEVAAEERVPEWVKEAVTL